MGARPPPPPSPLPSARCRERGAREAPVTAARASAASSAVRGGGGRRGPGTARRQPRRGWLGDCCGDDAGEWEGVEFASPPPRPGAALPGGGTPCLFLRGRWRRRRRRMERAPPPSSPPVPRPAGAEGDGAAETPSVSPPGVGPPVTVVPGFWGGDGTTDTTYSPSSPQRGAAAPLAGRAALGVAPAVTGRGPRPPLPRLCPRVCLTGLLPRPPPRRPPEPAAVSAGGSGERGFRRPGIGRRDDRLLAAEARCEARVGFLCLREWVCGGWGGGVYVCLFWFCPSPYRFFAARVRGRVKQSRGRRLRPLGRLSGECRRQLHFSLAASEGRVVSLLGFCRRFCETVACLSKIKPFIFPQTTLIVFCDRISVSFPSLSLPLSLWLMQWSEESCS